MGFYEDVFPPLGDMPYLHILANVHTLQGGNAAQLGNQGPIRYIGGNINYLQLDTNETRERLIGVLRLAYPFIPATGENPEVPGIQLIITSPPVIRIIN